MKVYLFLLKPAFKLKVQVKTNLTNMHKIWNFDNTAAKKSCGR